VVGSQPFYQNIQSGDHRGIVHISRLEVLEARLAIAHLFMHTENGPIAEFVGLFIPQKTLANANGTIDGVPDMNEHVITAIFEDPSTDALETIICIYGESILPNT
jgi:hypothetical protein